MVERRRRVMAVLVAVILVILGFSWTALTDYLQSISSPTSNNVLGTNQQSIHGNSQLAKDVLAKLETKGRAPKTGYSREQFGGGWGDAGNCDVRNFILARDMTKVITFSDEDCTVLAGNLDDPYTGKLISFERGPDTSDDVQIDHVVALSDAWQKGAQNILATERLALANDPLNLLAVDGSANQKKSDSDAASWLPPNKSYRCMYIARQIAVKSKYHLWVTDAERSAMNRVLNTCPSQQLPFVASQ